ncbi:MAG: DNA sulfur modification protein DndB, partial [Oscillospiraceae bacterium]
WIAGAMEKADPLNIKVSDYFSDNAIAGFKNYVKERINTDELYVFHDVYQLAERQWTTHASINTIALQSKYNIIHTDPNLQRQSKSVLANKETNEIIRKIYVNPKRVDAIEESLLNNEYAFNTIRLNLIDDGEFKPLYDDKAHTLTIPHGANCIILDGNHRRKACEQVYTHHPELRNVFATRNFQIAFTFFSPRRAKAVVLQEWNTERVSENHIKSMKQNMSNEVVDEIIRSDLSERIYADKIVTTGYDKRPGGSLIIYANLAEAINKYYKANNFLLLSEAKTLANWLIDFYNQLAVHFTQDFIDVKTSSKTKYVTNNYITSYGFVYLSKLLYGHENWKSELENVLNIIDWSNEHSVIDTSKSRANIVTVEALFEEAVVRANV